MNLTQAEAVVSLYTELLRHLEENDGFKAFTPPEPTFRKEQAYTRQDISIEYGQIKVKWSRYVGCGDYETEFTYHRLEDLFD